MKPLFATLALLLVSNVQASDIDSISDATLLDDAQDPATSETFTYDSVIRYFNANVGRVPTLQELAPSRICATFKPGSQVADGSVGMGIFSHVNLKVYFGGPFAEWIRQSPSWNAQQIQQLRTEAARVDFMSDIHNVRTAQEFAIRGYRKATPTVLEAEVKIRKSPSGRYYYTVEGIQANSGLRLITHAGVCEPTSIFAGSKFPL